jgi:hypothetical protein
MVQRGEQASLAFKSRAPVLVRRETFREDLEGDVATEARIVRPIDFTHPTGAEELEYFVVS